MNDNGKPKTGAVRETFAPDASQLNRRTLELQDFFLDTPPAFAQVELTDDPTDRPEVAAPTATPDLLTELLCEV